MASKGARHKNVYTTVIRPDGGLNYSVSPLHIADNELQMARNIIYDSQTGKPMTRPGTVCVTASALASPIRRLYYYEKDTTNKWLVCASGSKLYYLAADAEGTITTEDEVTLITESESSLTTEQTSPGYQWVEIGSLTGATAIPSFLTFNSKLLIADGGENIFTWDGTTYGALSDGLYATALATIKGRVVANSASDLDLVTLSGPETETDWDTGSGNAEAFRAGFGDEMTVNGFAVFGDDLIISKKGVARKMLYRLNIADATPANWYVQALTENNCAQNHQSIVSAFNNVYFIDTNGFKSLRGVTEYGDLQVDMLGSKINKVFSGSPTSDDMAYIPAYTAMWFCMSDRVFAFHRITDTDGNVKFAYTDMVFQQGRIRCAVQTGTTIYLGGSNGYLYSIGDTYGTDQVSPTSILNYTSELKTKSFSVMGDLIVRRMRIGFAPKVAGVGNITANDTVLKTFSALAAGEYLHDATGYLADATGYLYDDIAQPWTEHVRARYRDDEVAIGIITTSGRVVVENIDVEMAMVEGQ